jgi:hypothetical protein
MTVCAIHQPNFFPWLGYFDKIRRADVFVFLDDVAYPKSGSGTGSWVNRVRIAISNVPTWITCPIRREHGTQIIRNVHIDDSQPWRKKLLRTLDINYRKARNFAQVMPLLESLVMFETDNLCQFNLHAVTSICRLLGIESDFRLQSECRTTSAATQLLIDLTQIVGADTYLCGGGADGYQRDEMFPKNGLQIVYQNFVPEPYRDPPRFHPGLSVIDYILHTENPPFDAMPVSTVRGLN